MKTWKWLVIILVVALLVVYYILGMDFLKQRRQNVALASQISDTSAALAIFPPAPTDLEQRLTVARADLTAAENALAGETNDTRIVNAILRLAEEIGVKAIPLSTRPWTIENILDRDYFVFRLALAVTGDFTQLQSFTDRLENSELGTLVIEYLSVRRGSESSVENPRVNAKIAIAVYRPASAA